MMNKSLSLGVSIALVAITAGCAGRGDDPYEPLNRQVHAFNTGFDAAVVRPLTRPFSTRSAGSEDGPGLASTVAGVGSNLTLPGKSLNSLLQGRPGAAAQNAGRFVVNSTLGLGGLMDPAGREFALTEVDTDFGQTLQVWGVPEGAYLELPIVGPSNERDTVGRVVDWVIDPLDLLLQGDARTAATVLKLGGKAAKRAALGGTVDSVLHDSADSYTQTKLVWQQHRRHELGEEAETIDPYSE